MPAMQYLVLILKLLKYKLCKMLFIHVSGEINKISKFQQKATRILQNLKNCYQFFLIALFCPVSTLVNILQMFLGCLKKLQQ